MYARCMTRLRSVALSLYIFGWMQALTVVCFCAVHVDIAVNNKCTMHLHYYLHQGEYNLDYLYINLHQGEYNFDYLCIITSRFSDEYRCGLALLSRLIQIVEQTQYAHIVWHIYLILLLMETLISNLVGTTCFGNNLH